MLPKHSRLTKQTIEKSLVRARRLKTSSFLVMYTTIPGREPQVSVTISKKTAKTAVLRNKARRRAYSAARPLLPRLSPGSAVLVSYSSPMTTAPIPQLTAELEQALKKAGLFK